MNRTEAQQTAASATPGGTHVNYAHSLPIADQKHSQVLSLQVGAMAQHDALNHPAAATASIMPEGPAVAEWRLGPLLRAIGGTYSFLASIFTTTASAVVAARDVRSARPERWVSMAQAWVDEVAPDRSPD